MFTEYLRGWETSIEHLWEWTSLYEHCRESPSEHRRTSPRITKWALPSKNCHVSIAEHRRASLADPTSLSEHCQTPDLFAQSVKKVLVYAFSWRQRSPSCIFVKVYCKSGKFMCDAVRIVLLVWAVLLVCAVLFGCIVLLVCTVLLFWAVSLYR